MFLWLHRIWHNRIHLFSFAAGRIAVPLIGSLLVLGAERWAGKWRDSLAVLTALLTLVIVMLMLPSVLQRPLQFELPGIMQLGLLLRVDLLALCLLL